MEKEEVGEGCEKEADGTGWDPGLMAVMSGRSDTVL